MALFVADPFITSTFEHEQANTAPSIVSGNVVLGFFSLKMASYHKAPFGDVAGNRTIFIFLNGVEEGQFEEAMPET